MLHLYNSLTREKEAFHPLHPHEVSLYTCGPTVYNYAHIGNLRTYIFEDILKRVLKYGNYHVKHVMNITDVGHLTDDADQGEDKMEKGARREGKTAWEIAEFYTHAFKNDLQELDILEPTVWCKATDHIPEQIQMVQTLTDKGYTYETEDGIYFDTTKVTDYGKLVNLQNQELQAGSRVDMGDKKNPHDFALWKFTPEGEKRQMEWDAFGRKGFPGWHIECSAMAVKYLGEEFDIHCGGIDHKPVHHTNEIAQTESATGKKPWVHYWLHGEFLTLPVTTSAVLDAWDDPIKPIEEVQIKMAKSGENFITLQTVKERGFDPLDYRYFTLQAHYRKQLNFSWEALEAAKNGLANLRSQLRNLPERGIRDPKVIADFKQAVFDDLNMPEALAVLWTALKEHLIDLETVTEFDKVFGLHLHRIEEKPLEIPDEVQKLLNERIEARENKNWSESDRLRDQIGELGFTVEDTGEGQRVKKVKD